MGGKMKLADLSEINTPERERELKITTLPLYDKIRKEKGHRWFTETELKIIERRLDKKRERMSRKDLKDLLSKRGWRITDNKLKVYIKSYLVPRPMIIQRKGLYPHDFLRHLNFVRVAMEAGKKDFNEMKSILPQINEIYSWFEKRWMADMGGKDSFEMWYNLIAMGFDVLFDSLPGDLPEMDRKSNKKYHEEISKLEEGRKRLSSKMDRFFKKYLDKDFDWNLE